MATESGWDTVFAEPVRWSRKGTVKKCWDHIKYTIVAAVCIMVLLWFTQGHRYLYNVLYGPFVLSEQEILDTRPENMWKQYIQVHHGRHVEIDGLRCEGRPCSAGLVHFKKRAAHNSNINQLLVKKPKSLKHGSYSKRHPINFSVMSAKKLKAIIQKIGLEKSVIPFMEKSELVSIITKAYDSNPKAFNKATSSEVLVGFLTDFDVIDVYRNPEFMALVLDTDDPYFTILSFPSLFALIFAPLYVFFVMKILYYIFKLAKTWVSSSRIFTSFGSTEYHKQILGPLKCVIQPQGLQVNSSLSVYDCAAMKLHKEILSAEVSKIVNEEHFRIFVTKKHVVYLRNDVVDVISVSEIDEIIAWPWSDTCQVHCSGNPRTLNMSSDQASHMRNVLMSRSARFRQLEEERMLQRQQEEEERLRRRQKEEEERSRDEAEQEARRRRQEEETIRRINEFLARLAEREGERPATEEVVEEMKESAFKLKVDSEEICAICQDGMKKGEKVIPFPCPAEHQFHEDCMLQFLAHGSSCPLCRHQVEHDTPVDEHALLGILQLLFT